MMKRPTLMILIGCVLIGGLSSLFAQGTAFSYHGRLADDANPGNGGYDFVFTLFDDELARNFSNPSLTAMLEPGAVAALVGFGMLQLPASFLNVLKNANTFAGANPGFWIPDGSQRH